MLPPDRCTWDGPTRCTASQDANRRDSALSGPCGTHRSTRVVRGMMIRKRSRSFSSGGASACRRKRVGDMRGPRSPSRVTEVLATADGRVVRRCHAAGRMAPGRRRASRAVRWLRNRCRRARRAFTTATAAPTRRFALHHPGLLQRPAARWRNRTDRTGSRHRRVGCRPVRRYPALAEAAGLPDQTTHNC